MHINSFPGGAFHFKSLARHFQGLSRGANQMRKNERNARFFFFVLIGLRLHRSDQSEAADRASGCRFLPTTCALFFFDFFFRFFGSVDFVPFYYFFLFLFTSRRRRIRQCRLTFSRQRRRRTMFFLSKACPFPVKEKPRKQKIK